MSTETEDTLNLKYKYQHQLEKYNFTELERDFGNISTECYRYVFEDINDSRNFIPPNIIEPTRIMHSKTDLDRCKGFALSFFVDKQKAIHKYRYLIDNRPNLVKRIGTHIAFGTVIENDGKTDGISNISSHYDLFEFINTNLRDSFKLDQKLAE